MFRDKRGFTLIEVLISMLILLTGLLGALLGVLSALNHNLNNAMRSEAMAVAREQMETLRNVGYNAPVLNPGTTMRTVQRQFRKNLADFTITSTVATDVANPYVKAITVRVQWTAKNIAKSYTLESIRRQP